MWRPDLPGLSYLYRFNRWLTAIQHSDHHEVGAIIVINMPNPHLEKGKIRSATFWNNVLDFCCVFPPPKKRGFVVHEIYTYVYISCRLMYIMYIYIININYCILLLFIYVYIFLFMVEGIGRLWLLQNRSNQPSCPSEPGISHHITRHININLPDHSPIQTSATGKIYQAISPTSLSRSYVCRSAEYNSWNLLEWCEIKTMFLKNSCPRKLQHNPRVHPRQSPWPTMKGIPL